MDAVGCGDGAIAAMGVPKFAGAGFADASYAPDGERERKSVSGYVFLVYGNIVSWKSKLQPITAGSTHEAELIGLATAANEGVWLHRLLSEVRVVGTKPVQFLNMLEMDPTEVVDSAENAGGLSDEDEDESRERKETARVRPLLIFGDNKGSIFTTANPEVSSNSKHLHVRYYKIREYVRDNLLRIRYCNTNDNLADFFTKGLERIKFERFRKVIMNQLSADPAEILLGAADKRTTSLIAYWDVRGDEDTRSAEALMLAIGHIPAR